MAIGKVSIGTEMQEWGAQQMEEGWAMTAGAGQPANVQQNLMQAAQQRGAYAAHQIRQRYFKKEFDTVQKVKAAPLYKQMEDAKAAYDFETKIEIGAIQTIQSAVQAMDEDIALTNQASAGTAQPNLGINSNPEGVANTPVAHSEVAPPPPTSDGGIHTEQGESYLLEDGRRIGITTDEGFLHQQQASMRVSEVIKRVSLELNDLAAGYAGNPFMDKWGESLADNLVKHSNMAATGMGDPAEAMKKYQQFQQRDADLTASEDVHESNVFSQDTRQAIRDQGADEFIQRAQADPTFSGNVRSELLERARNNPEALTDKQRATLGVGLQSWKADAEKQIASQKASGFLTPSQLNVPKNFPSYISTNKRRQQLYTQHRAEAAAGAGEVARATLQGGGAPAADMREKLIDLGMEDADLLKFMKGQGNDNIQAAMEAYVESDPDLYRQANGRADVERLIEMVRDDPSGAGRMVDNTVEAFIDRNDFSNLDAQLIRDQKANYFIEITQEYDPGYTSLEINRRMAETEDAYSRRASPDIEGPLAPVPLSPGASRSDEIAYSLGLPQAPTRNYPQVTHKGINRSQFVPMSRSNTGSGSLVAQAMSGRSFSDGPRGVSDLDMIAKIVAERKTAERVATAVAQGGQVLDSMRPNAERRRLARIANR